MCSPSFLNVYYFSKCCFCMIYMVVLNVFIWCYQCVILLSQVVRIWCLNLVSMFRIVFLMCSQLSIWLALLLKLFSQCVIRCYPCLFETIVLHLSQCFILLYQCVLNCLYGVLHFSYGVLNVRCCVLDLLFICVLHLFSMFHAVFPMIFQITCMAF